MNKFLIAILILINCSVFAGTQWNITIHNDTNNPIWITANNTYYEQLPDSAVIPFKTLPVNDKKANEILPNSESEYTMETDGNPKSNANADLIYVQFHDQNPHGDVNREFNTGTTYGFYERGTYPMSYYKSKVNCTPFIDSGKIVAPNFIQAGFCKTINWDNSGSPLRLSTSSTINYFSYSDSVNTNISIVNSNRIVTNVSQLA